MKDGRPGEKRRREVLVLKLRPRPPSGSPGRARALRRGASELLYGLSDGDMYGMRPSELPYRASPRESGPTFGDYEFGIGYPSGLGSAGQEAYGEVPIAQSTAAPVQGPTPPAAMAPEASSGATAPSPLDVLITGMSQLQQVLLKQKGGETLDLTQGGG